MKKKLILFLLTFILLSATGTVASKAYSFRYASNIWHFEDLTGVWVNGQQLTNGQTIRCGSGGATLDTNTIPYTLYLTNAEITEWKNVGDFGLGIASNVELNIILKGTSYIKIKRSNFVVGIAAPMLNFYGDGTLIMDLKVRDVHIKPDDYKSLYVMNAVGIAASGVCVYGGQYNIDCSDDINYISHAIQTDYLFIAKGQFALFGSGGAFTKEPSYSLYGDAYPCYSRYSTVSNVKTGSSPSGASSAQKADLQDYHKYVFFNVSAHCDTVEMLSISSPISGRTVGESMDVSPLATQREIKVKSVAWYDSTGSTGLTGATRFEDKQKYQLIIHLTSPVSGMFDSSTKVPSLSGRTNPTATGKLINQNGELVYVLTITMNCVEDVNPEVWINGSRYTTDPAGGTIEYDKFSHVLELTNATLDQYCLVDGTNKNAIIYSKEREGLTIKLEGNNYIRLSQIAGTNDIYGIGCEGPITFTGSGTLTILLTDDNSYGIYSDQSIALDSNCSVNVTAEMYGLYSINDNITNNGTLTVYGKDTGIFADSGDLINNGNIFATSNDTPIYLFHGKLNNTSNQKVLGSTKVQDNIANLTEANFGTAKTTLKSNNQVAKTVFIGIPGHTHIYSQKVESPEYLVEFASCTENCRYYYSCSCGEKDPNGRYFESSHKGSHNAEFVSKKDATCQADGCNAYYKCTSCGKAFSDSACTKEITNMSSLVIPKISHTASDWITDKAAAVGVEGHRHKECTMCKTVLQEESIPALKAECKHEHSTVQNQKNATCQQEGYSGDKVCTDCGKVLEAGTVLPKTDHDYGTDGVCKTCGVTDPNRASDPTGTPDATPTPEPTGDPDATPTPEPTGDPDATPTPELTGTPDATPTPEPTGTPDATPTTEPTDAPDATPTATPTVAPTNAPNNGNTSGKKSSVMTILFIVLAILFAAAIGVIVYLVLKLKKNQKA